MALTECANGHLYDTSQYQSCPYCSGGTNQVVFGAGGDSGVGRTVGVGMGGSQVQAAPVSEVGATVAPASYSGARRPDPDRDTGKTVAVLQKSFAREPVTGWLVCVEGTEQGKDYRIAAKINSIGRSEAMDICIKGDAAISRENHARLAYDGKHNQFHLIPAESVNGIYVNDEPVYVPTCLKAGDIIELGESRFRFIPFCDDRFNWKDGVKQGEA